MTFKHQTPEQQARMVNALAWGQGGPSVDVPVHTGTAASITKGNERMKIPLKIQLETERTMLLEVIETLEDARRRHRLHTNTAVSLQRAIATVDTVVGRLRRAESVKSGDK